MKTWSFSGMGRIFNVQDTAIVEGSGPIVDRTREFLGPSDRAIIAARRQVLRAIRDVEAGREAPHVIRSSGKESLSGSDGGFRSDHRRNRLADSLEEQTRGAAVSTIP